MLQEVIHLFFSALPFLVAYLNHLLVHPFLKSCRSNYPLPYLPLISCSSLSLFEQTYSLWALCLQDELSSYPCLILWIISIFGLLYEGRTQTSSARKSTSFQKGQFSNEKIRTMVESPTGGFNSNSTIGRSSLISVCL